MIRESVPVDRDMLAEMLRSALRYALGRRTHIVSTTCEWVTTYAPQLTAAQRRMLRGEVENDLRRGEESGIPVGDKCDVDNWQNLVEWLMENR